MAKTDENKPLNEEETKKPFIKDITEGAAEFKEMSEDEISASTVFSKPVIEHKKVKKSGSKGFIVKIIVSLLVVAAIITGTLLLNKYGPADMTSSGEADTSAISSLESESKETEKGIKLTSYETNDLSKLEITNKNGKLSFYPVKGEEADENDEIINLWYLSGIERRYIDTDVTSLTVGDCASCEAIDKYEYKEGTDYGFDNPEATAVVTTKGNKPNYTLTVGKRQVAGSIGGSYVKLSTDDKYVYFIAAEHVDYYTQSAQYYISVNAPTAITQTKENSKYFGQSLDTFDYITISGRAAKEQYRFEMSGRENSSVMYRMTAPYTYNADETAVSEMLDIIRNDLECYKVYYFNIDGIPEKVIKDYKLDNPDAVITYKVGKDTVKLKLKQSATDKNYFAMTVNDGNVIYAVTKLSFTFIEKDFYTFVSQSVLLENIEGIGHIDIKVGGKNYGLDTTSKTVKAEDDSEDDTVTTTAVYDGKKIKEENFSNYYYNILSIQPYITSTSILTKAPKNITEYYSVTMKHNKKTSDPDINMTVYKIKGNTARYYIELDGIPVGLCETKSTDILHDNVVRLINNKTIKSFGE